MSKLQKIIKYLSTKTIFYVVLLIIILFIVSSDEKGVFIKLLLYVVPILIIAYLVCIFVKEYISAKSAISRGEYIAYSLKRCNKSCEDARTQEQKDLILIHKAELLNLIGDWQQSLDILRTIDIKSISKKLIGVCYYNNILFALFFSDRYDEAIKLYNDNQKMFIPNTENNNVNGMIKTNLATLEYFTGEIEESKKMLTRLLEEKLPGYYRLIVLYLLGMVYLKNGDVEMSEKYFNDAISVGAETFVPKKIKEVYKKEK